MTCLGGSSVYVAAESKDYALVTVAAASMRSEPSNASELETQATYGTPLRVVEREGEWLKVITPENYSAYVNESAVALMDSAAMKRWRQSDRLIVTALRQVTAVSDTLRCDSPRSTVFDMPLGAIVEGRVSPGAKFTEVSLPDGRKGYVEVSSLADFSVWSGRDVSVDDIVDAAYSMNGVTYLWGGTTPKAIDCSGLTKVCYFTAGLILPRNASQQARCGRIVSTDKLADLHRGDLLFFGDGDGERITHVGLYDGDGVLIHASGRVSVASLNEDSPLYLSRKVLRAVRVIGEPQGEMPVVHVASHPWYF